MVATGRLRRWLRIAAWALGLALAAAPCQAADDDPKLFQPRQLGKTSSGDIAPMLKQLAPAQESGEEPPAPLPGDRTAAPTWQAQPEHSEAVEPPPAFRRPGLFGRGGEFPGPPTDRCSTETWSHEPYSFGVFAGVLVASPVSTNWLGQRQGYVGGLRLGYDFNEHWGGELRYSLGSAVLYDSPRAIEARLQADINAGYTGNDLRRYIYEPTRYADRTTFDLSAVYYPWGDTRLRPYILFGLGLTQFRYSNVFRDGYFTTDMSVPFGIGFRYLCSEQLALRVECTDTLIFAGMSNLNTMHDLTFTGALELRFGRQRKSYWPWVPGARSW